MKRNRINFKTMNYTAFINYLDKRYIQHELLQTTTVLGTSVNKVIPQSKKLKPRAFDSSTGIQLDASVQLTDIDFGSNTSLKQLIKIIDAKISSMSTKGVYHPRRLKPKWFSLKTDKQRLELYKKYMKAKDSSIGFIRLIKVNLPHKTMESVIIEHPEFDHIIDVDDLKQKCIDKFMLYENGRTYLQQKGLI